MTEPLRIDIISDVVCPWCAVGYNQLRVALEETGIEAEIHWHPFQLNPDMPDEGQERLGYLSEKYGISIEEARANQQRIAEAGKAVGFTFNFTDDMRTYNTLNAHQLIHWAREEGKGHEMKLALLQACFTDGKHVGDIDVLMEITASLGLDAGRARKALEEQTYQEVVRQHLAFWQQKGISSVPAVVLDSKYLLNGAAGVDQFKHALTSADGERG